MTNPVKFLCKTPDGNPFEDSVSRPQAHKTKRGYRGSFDGYLEANKIDRATCSDTILAESAINYFNSTLRSGEVAREFISLVE